MEEVVCVSDLHGRREVGATQGAVAGNKQSKDVGRYDSRDGGGSLRLEQAVEGCGKVGQRRSSCRDGGGSLRQRPTWT